MPLTITFGEEASEQFSNWLLDRAGWYVRLTTQEGETREAIIVGPGDDWHDAVAFYPCDDEGIKLSNVVETVRVSDLHVY